jgi:hypothetical protein
MRAPGRKWLTAFLVATAAWGAALLLLWAVHPFWMAFCPNSMRSVIGTSDLDGNGVTSVTCGADWFAHYVTVTQIGIYVLSALVASIAAYLLAPTRQWLSALLIFPIALYGSMLVFTSPAGVYRYLSIWFFGHP